MDVGPRVSLWLLALGVGCAAAPDSPAGDSVCPEGADCAAEADAADPAAEPRYEAREVVLAAEAERKAAAFRERLDRMRADEEARAEVRAARAQAEGAARNEAALSALTASSPLTEAASDAAPPAPLARAPRVEVEVPPSASVQRSEAGVAAAQAARPPGPEPAELLVAARCLLEAEAKAAGDRIDALRRRGASRTEQGAWALALVDVQALVADVAAALGPERSTKSPQVCANPSNPERALLRTLYGPGAVGRVGAAETSRGVERLRSELQARAGLPAPE